MPLGVMHLDQRGSTPQEKQAIDNEIGIAFSESALNIGRGVLKEMLARTKDPSRREEIEDAIREIESSRESMREAGKEVERAKRQAATKQAAPRGEAVERVHRNSSSSVVRNTIDHRSAGGPRRPGGNCGPKFISGPTSS